MYNFLFYDCSAKPLHPPVPPSVSLPPSIVASQGDPLSLDCSASGNPPPSLSWYKDGQPLPSNGRVSISPEREVAIASLYSTDDGDYTCVASNSEGSASATTTVTVLGESLVHTVHSM